jgi:penicillin-binding protein activator
MSISLRALFSLAFALGLLPAACGSPQPIRGEDVEGFDDQAMSTGLDKRDLSRMLHENMQSLQSSAVIKQWERENRPTVAVLPLKNDTSEHVDSALDALISEIETRLVNAGHVRVISMQQQPGLIEEVRRQYSGAFDPSQHSRWGKQIGARYVVTGKVYDAAERHADERRVQYFMFLQVLQVETGEILFQNRTHVTKGIAR